MKLERLLLLLSVSAFFQAGIFAQVTIAPVKLSTADPSGACPALKFDFSSASAGTPFWCNPSTGVWATLGGGTPVFPGGSPGDVQCNVANAFGPCSTGVVTSDSSGNFKALSFIAGSGGGVAGALDIGQGTLPTLGTNAISLLGPTSVTSYGLKYPGAAPSVNQFLLWGTPSSGVSTGVFTGFTSTNLTDTANLVRNQGINTGSSAMTLDMSASTGASAFKAPVGVGLTTAINGAIGYDSTADMLHAAQGSADAKIPQFTVTPVNGDCANWVVSGSKYKLGTAGSPCGSGGGGSGNSVTSVTPITVSANSTSEQQLIELTLTAGYFNSLRQPFLFNGAGVYTTPIGQTPTLTFKVKLCTVSGCGSGTVVTLASIASTATLANSTNNTWNVNFLGYTAAVGATGNLEIHGPLTVDLGSLSTSPDSVFNDTNTAVSGNIDLTAALFVDFTVTTSTGSTSNSITQRSGGVMPFAATAAPVTSVNGMTGAVTVSGSNITQGTAASLPATCTTNDLYYMTNSVYTARCSSTNTWSYFSGMLGNVTRPTSTGWTWSNQGSCTIDSTNGYEYESCPANGGTTNSARIRYKAAPGGSFTLTACFLHDTAGSDGGFAGYGLYFGDGTKWVSFNLQAEPTTWALIESEWTTSSAFSTVRLEWNNSGPSRTSVIVGNPSCLQLVYNGTTMVYNYSADSFHWNQFDSRSATSFLASVSQVGWGSNPINNQTDVALIHWTGP
jgi:hypothetical protein